MEVYNKTKCVLNYETVMDYVCIYKFGVICIVIHRNSLKT